ncbi:hypothetical protein [Olivibacter sp. SDN3]|nr:hypothetical protein [Olivibacter sp. SDN3]
MAPSIIATERGSMEFTAHGQGEPVLFGSAYEGPLSEIKKQWNK